MTYTKVSLQGEEISIDNYLLKKMEAIKWALEHDHDIMFIIDGKERSGKSTLALQLGAYLYPQLSADNIAIDAADAIKKFEMLPPKSVLIIDEGSLMFSSRDAMMREQRRIVKILSIIGQKNLVFIVCLPSFFNLNRYIAVERSRFLIHIYTDEKLQRGKFAYFGERQLRPLYDVGRKKYNSYAYPEAETIGQFVKWKPKWHEEYLKVKEKTLLTALHDEMFSSGKRSDIYKLQRDKLIVYLHDVKKEKQKTICGIAGIDKSAVSDVCKAWKASLSLSGNNIIIPINEQQSTEGTA